MHGPLGGDGAAAGDRETCRRPGREVEIDSPRLGAWALEPLVARRNARSETTQDGPEPLHVVYVFSRTSRRYLFYVKLRCCHTSPAVRACELSGKSRRLRVKLNLCCNGKFVM